MLCTWTSWRSGEALQRPPPTKRIPQRFWMWIFKAYLTTFAKIADILSTAVSCHAGLICVPLQRMQVSCHRTECNRGASWRHKARDAATLQLLVKPLQQMHRSPGTYSAPSAETLSLTWQTTFLGGGGDSGTERGSGTRSRARQVLQVIPAAFQSVFADITIRSIACMTISEHPCSVPHGHWMPKSHLLPIAHRC